MCIRDRMIAIFFVRLGQNEYIMGALYKGMFGSAILAGIAFYFVTDAMMVGIPGIDSMSLYLSTLVGLILTVLIVVITEYYTGIFNPVKSVAEASKTGHATNIIAGLAVSMQATAAPVIAICVGIYAAYELSLIHISEPTRPY